MFALRGGGATLFSLPTIIRGEIHSGLDSYMAV